MNVIHLKTYKELRDIPSLSEDLCRSLGMERPELIAECIERYIDNLEWNEFTEVLELLRRRYFESPFEYGDIDFEIDFDWPNPEED